MELLVFSDTHQRINGCIDVIGQSGRVDAVLHAGDLVRDAEDLARGVSRYPVLLCQRQQRPV